MPRLTFRTKLLLAMMLVVAGVSLATLLITQQRVQANYDRMFRSQFERQIGYFTSLQEARLSHVKEQCLTLSQSVRIIAALKETEVDLLILYRNADDELRTVLEGGRDEPRPGGRRGYRLSPASFFRFVDAQGKPLTPPDSLPGRIFSPTLRHKLEQNLGFVRAALAAPQVQQVAYLPLTLKSNQFDLARMGPLRFRASPRQQPDSGELPSLQEVVVTKIVDPADNHTLGALALGFPLPDLVPQFMTREALNSATNKLDLIQAGILIEDHLYANPAMISESLGEQVAKAVTDHIRAGETNRAEFNSEIVGTPYRILYDRLNEDSRFPAAYQVCLYSMAEAQHEQRALRWRIAGSATAALLVALLLSLAITHGLSAPIRELVAGTGEIQRGNFAVRVPVRTEDELGQLATSFNEMAEGLAQKERYRTVLNMVADEKVAQLLVAGELTLGGGLREISVLFCDIRGFTALTQNMPPGEIIEMLNEHMTALVRVVKEHHGHLDKFVGDLLMAIFGAPLSHGQDAVNAARCALRLIEVRGALDQTSRYKLPIGIGIATGTVVAGCMGSTDRMNYTVLGERVNLASRLCDHALAGEILVDEHTHRLLEGILPSTPTGEIELKGFAAPVPAFRLGRMNG